MLDRIITKINTFLKTYFKIGFMKDFPYRTATLFAKERLKEKKNIICIEIGSFEGDHALFMLKNLPIKTLYLIDPWESYSEYNEERSNDIILNTAYRKLIRKLRKYRDKVKIIRKYSHKALEDIPSNIDFIYIDGNHDYKYVKRDMANYYNKLVAGGVMGGHDINYLGVIKAFCEFVADKKVVPRIKIMDWMFVKEGKQKKK